MESLLVRLDDATFRALKRVAPTAQRKRAEFVRAAIREAICEAQDEGTRRAYLKQPDTETAADDWQHAEEWIP
jgi:predicted transcriptional regulator